MNVNNNSNNINNNNLRIIGKKGDLYLATNDKNATINDTFCKVFIVEQSGEIITEELPIRVFTKYEKWEKIEGFYSEYIKNSNFDYIRNSLMGAAVGDAFGVPYEFLSREQISKLPITGMVGKDTKPEFISRWNQVIPAGAWSDDTAMIVATMESIIESGDINYDSIMKNYIKWWNTGLYSSLSFPFGLGSTIYNAFEKYQIGESAINCGGKDFMDNGNGSLMRILPFSLYCIKNNLDEYETLEIISNGSSLTHGNEISKMACYMYTIFLKEAIRTKNKFLAFKKMIYTNYNKFFSKSTINSFKRINNPNFNLKPSDIKETGYVVDTFETVIYSLLKSNNYREVIENCIKLGYDTDTSASIAGSLAGVIYGYDDIPKEWLEKLRKRDYLEELSSRFDKAIHRDFIDKKVFK